MLLFKGFVFGFSLAIAIGPIALLIFDTGLRSGLASALRSGLGAALADLTYALVSFLLGRTLVAGLAVHALEIRSAASGVLIAFGLWMTVRAVRAGPGSSAGAGPDAQAAARSARILPEGRELVGTYLLTIVNPLTVLLFTTFAAQQGAGEEPWFTAILLAFFVGLGSLSVQVVIALAGAQLGRVIEDPRWMRGLGAVSGGAIALFGISGFVG
jgi:threonine/homoserine/homoserine lactone efflux protein